MTAILFLGVLSCYLIDWLRSVVQTLPVVDPDLPKHANRPRTGIAAGQIVAREQIVAIAWGAHAVLLIWLILQAGLDAVWIASAAGWLVMLGYLWGVGRTKHALRRFFPPLAMALLLAALGLHAGQFSALYQGALAQALLGTHIVAVLASVVLFGASSIWAGLYLRLEQGLKTRKPQALDTKLPSLDRLERGIHRAMGAGFFFLTAGIFAGLLIRGSIPEASYVPTFRQVVPLAPWLFYAYVLARSGLRGRRGRQSAYGAIFGFSALSLVLIYELSTLFYDGS